LVVSSFDLVVGLDARVGVLGRVLELVAAGMSNEQITERLFLSPRTVERHLSNVYAKLRLSGKSARAAAVAPFSARKCRPRPSALNWRRRRRRAFDRAPRRHRHGRATRHDP
jgi:hypothetical protein